MTQWEAYQIKSLKFSKSNEKRDGEQTQLLPKLNGKIPGLPSRRKNINPEFNKEGKIERRGLYWEELYIVILRQQGIDERQPKNLWPVGRAGDWRIQ